MKPGTFRGDAILITMVMLTLVLASVFISIPVSITRASVTELNVEPEVINPGEVITITGKAAPNEEVWLRSSFELLLDVEDGRYFREFRGVHFPEGEKKFSVRAENVKNIRVSLSPVFWQTIEYPLEGPRNATNGIASLSISFPLSTKFGTFDIKGKKDVRVYGDAVAGATSVSLKTATSIKVVADTKGAFSLELNTEGVPEGEFLISAGEKERRVLIRGAPTPTSTPAPTPTTPVTSSPTPSPIRVATPPPSTIKQPWGISVIIIAVLIIITAYYFYSRRKE